MPKFRVLIVDDNAQYAESLKGYFQSQEKVEGVDAAQDGKAALTMLKERRYDVVTLDLIMPNTDGLSVLEQLPAVLGAQVPPVVVVSALRNEAMVRRCCALGARYYMVKPVERTYCTSALRRCWKPNPRRAD